VCVKHTWRKAGFRRPAHAEHHSIDSRDVEPCPGRQEALSCLDVEPRPYAAPPAGAQVVRAPKARVEFLLPEHWTVVTPDSWASLDKAAQQDFTRRLFIEDMARTLTVYSVVAAAPGEDPAGVEVVTTPEPVIGLIELKTYLKTNGNEPDSIEPKPTGSPVGYQATVFANTKAGWRTRLFLGTCGAAGYLIRLVAKPELADKLFEDLVASLRRCE